MLHGGSFSFGLPTLQVCIPIWLRLLRLTNSLELFAHTAFNCGPVFTRVMHKQTFVCFDTLACVICL